MGESVKIKANILDPSGKMVAQVVRDYKRFTASDSTYHLDTKVFNPRLWDIQKPNLYKLAIEVEKDGKTVDSDEVTFGIRSIKLVQGEGFYLNGHKVKFQGVCMHHDQGPLGAIVNEASYRRQIKIMQDMGVNAIRTSHNMPAPEFVKLCDEMGMISWLRAGKFPKYLMATTSIMTNGMKKIWLMSFANSATLPLS